MNTGSNPLRNAYFGDLHVHSASSFDAYNMGVRATVDDAYRYAKGEAIEHPLGYTLRLTGGLLDFYDLSDHAEYLGAVAAMADPNNPLAAHPVAKKIQSNDPAENMEAFRTFGKVILQGISVPDLDAASVIRSTWQANIEAADHDHRSRNPR